MKHDDKRQPLESELAGRVMGSLGTEIAVYPSADGNKRRKLITIEFDSQKHDLDEVFEKLRDLGIEARILL